MGRFQGFSPQTYDFLMALRFNNSKSYFEAHRETYEQSLLQPMRDLAFDLASHMLAIDAQFDARPVIGGAISRIYRDARRVRGGPPCRDYMWLGYRRRHDDNKLGFFFDIDPEGCSVGMGIFETYAGYMKTMRTFIQKNAGQYKDAWHALEQGGFAMRGPEFIRPPLTSKDPEVAAILHKRTFHFTKAVPMDVAFSPQLSDYLCAEFSVLQIMYDFLRRNHDA